MYTYTYQYKLSSGSSLDIKIINYQRIAVLLIEFCIILLDSTFVAVSDIRVERRIYLLYFSRMN